MTAENRNPTKSIIKEPANELAAFLTSLEGGTREVLVKCLHLHGEEGDALTEKQKVEQLRSVL